MVETRSMKLRQRSMPHIPHELHPQILVHLPVKSLIRFRCVSKSWEAFIVDPDFARSHLSHQNSSNNVNNDQIMVLHRDFSSNIDSVVRYNKDFKVEATLGILQTNKLPVDNLKSLHGSHHSGYTKWNVKGSIDGLIMLKSYNDKSYTDEFMLWNPSMRKVRVLPPSPLKDYKYVVKDVGLGFDPSIKDYKYVTFVRIRKGGVVGYVMHSFLVYTLGTNSWKQNLVSNGRLKAIHSDSIKSVCFGGVMYFIIRRYRERDVVASYDLRGEEFSHGNLPRIEERNYVEYDDEYRDYTKSLTLANDGSSLALVYLCEYNSKGWIYSGQVGSTADHITWIKVHTFRSTMKWDIYRRFLYFKNEDEIFLVLKKDWVEWVWSFDPKTEKEKVLVKMDKGLGMFDAYPYVESLMLVNE